MHKIGFILFDENPIALFHRISRYRMRAWLRFRGPDFALINPSI